MLDACSLTGALLEAEQPTEKAAKVYGFELKVNKMCDTAHQATAGNCAIAHGLTSIDLGFLEQNSSFAHRLEIEKAAN